MGGPAAELIAEIFGLLLPLGFVGMPLVAYFLEKRTFNETFTFINILGVVSAVTVFI